MEQSKHKKKYQNKKQTIKIAINDSGHGDSEAASTTSSAPSPVDVMTSRDFQLDTNAHIEMMDQMLKDSVRVENFKAAILHNKHLFKDKCVLNISCGIGIYSLFAAKAGAAKVYAIDPSNVVYYTRKIVEANNFANVIEVIKGNIEQVELPVKEVDIIISDWMGYAMLFQSSCDSVIYARDKWLKKPGGLIFPDKAQLFMVALEDAKHKNENIDWWNDVYGFSMKCFRNFALSEPRYQIIRPQQILSKQCPIKSLNLNTATRDDLKLRTKYMLPINRSGRMDGVALYFHVFFTKSHTPLGFSTDPWSPGTNWMQTILFFDQSLSVSPNTLYYGGIEFYSAATPCDLNDMIVNLEMLMGDPTQAEVEVEMSWRLKPATALLSGQINKSDICNVTKITNGNSVSINKKQNIKDSKNQLDLSNNLDKLNDKFTQLTAGDRSNQTFIKKSAEVSKPVTPKSPITSTTNHQPNDFDTLLIGKHHYPCRKIKKRTKSKY